MAKRSRVPAPPIYFNHHDLANALSTYTGYLLSYVEQMAHIHVDERLKPLHIDVRQFGVMILIAETEHRSQIAISENMGLDRTHVVRLVDELERLGYVARDVEPADRRYYRLALTEKGVKAYEQAKAWTASAQDEIYATFSADERATFHRLLLKLSRESFPGSKRTKA